MKNIDLWNLLRKNYPKFSQHTSKGTAEMFTSEGFEAISRTDRTALNEFYELSMQTILNQVNLSDAKDPFDSFDVGENYSTPYGGFLQRLAINSVKPTTPKYTNLTNGTSVDMYQIRKADVTERFFQQNFSYQSFVTIPADDLYKQIFASEYGMSEYVAGIYKGLENGFTTQKYVNKLECINALINSTNHPLQTTQKYLVPFTSADPTAEEIKDLWITFNNVITAMTLSPQTGAFNAEGFETTQEPSRLRLLIKQGYISNLNANVLASAFNPDKIGLPADIQIMQVANFGGLIPYKTLTTAGVYQTQLYPVYDNNGEQIGYNEQPNQTAVTVTNENVVWKDPNENVIAVLADKGFIFTATQNNYSVQPTPFNPAGLYTNVFANAPYNYICGDPLYNMVVFERTLPTPSDVVSI